MATAGGRLTDKFSRIAALRPARTLEPIAAQLERETDELSRLLGAEIERNKYGEHLAIRKWFATPDKCFEAGDPGASASLDLLLAKTNVPPRGLRTVKDPGEWLFLDTETTGISGGSGMYAFLIGLAWWDSGGLQVEQLFMRDHSEEYALLETLRQRMAERRVLVTFNGKTFDWPLLQTRFVMTRAIETPLHEVHLDFLHPARQIWRPRLLSVRLAELEQHVLRVSPGSRLDWTREGDIDGAMIPQLYFDYVRRGASPPLLPVFHHNQMDLRGLAALAGKILEILGEAGKSSRDSDAEEDAQRTVCEESEDMYGVSRLLENRGARGLARKSYEAALSAGLPARLERATRVRLARIANCEKNHARASELWESLLEPRKRRSRSMAQTDALEMSAGSQSLTLERILLRGTMAIRDEKSQQLREQLEACEQLAIHFERRTRDFDRAMQLTEHALALLRRARSARYSSPMEQSSNRGALAGIELRFEKRLARLVKNAGRVESLPLVR
jgi:uncharacterized protein YprB with RNaseH-like and TPR domain